jgi:hypothetical protein
MLSLRRSAAVFSLALILALAFAAANAQAAPTTVSGTVVCANDESVVGIWLQVWGESGASVPLSDWQRMPGASNVAQYRQRTTAGSKISLHVRCAGGRSRHGSDSRTAKISVHPRQVVNAICRPGAVRGALRCKLPTIGLTAPDDRNHFDGGWCTWGAATMLHRATGKYPGWFGNAKDWAAGAKGWLVSSKPMAHSIFVYPSGLDSSPLGHVGWVDSVDYRPDGVYLRTTEMNGWHGGLYRWSHERTKYRRTMRFILVP